MNIINNHPSVPLIIQFKRLLNYNACNKIADLLGDVNTLVPNRSILSLQKYLSKFSTDVKPIFERAVWFDYDKLVIEINAPILKKLKSM
jgi:hypothetical protein